MNLDFICISLLILQCTAQDYNPTYNPDVNQPNPTISNDYLSGQNDPRYDNPYDPNRRYQNRNQYNNNQNVYDPNQRYDNRNDPNQRYDTRNDPAYTNQNTFSQDNTPRPSWDTGRTYSTSYKSPPLEQDSVIINEATYFIVASRMVRPGQIYKISANILQARLQMTVRASIARDGVEIADVIQRVKEGVPEILNMRIPATSVPGDYKLRVEGLYLDNPFGGRAFVNETQLMFSRRFMTIFIQMDKPVYMQGQTVRFRAIPINTELKAFGRAIDVYILDPNGHIMKRWLSRQSNFGTVSLQYQLSDQPLFGMWTIKVEALGQTEETQFLVEEYYQTRYEVNVTMPAFFFNTDPFIHGRIMANYTSGAPVRGNLTLKATVRPIPRYRPRYYDRGQFNNRGQFGPPLGLGSSYTREVRCDARGHVRPIPRYRPRYYDRGQFNNRGQFGPPLGLGSSYTRVRPNYNPYLYNESGYQPYDYYGPLDEYGRAVERRVLPGQPNQIDQPDWVYDLQQVKTRMFNFRGLPALRYYGPLDEYERRVLSGQPNQIDQPDWVYDLQQVKTRMFNFCSSEGYQPYDIHGPLDEYGRRVLPGQPDWVYDLQQVKTRMFNFYDYYGPLDEYGRRVLPGQPDWVYDLQQVKTRMFNFRGLPALRYYGPLDEYERRVLSGQPNQIDQPDWVYDLQQVKTRMFNFDEKYPFWMTKPDPLQYINQNNPDYNNYQTSTSSYSSYYNTPYDQLPYLRFFNGTYDFKYPMSELAQLVPDLDGVEVIITASVGDPFLDEVIEGYSIARIFNSSLQVSVLGGTPQVFKPSMPFDVYMVVSYHDGSPLPPWQAAGVSLVVNLQVEGRGGNVEPQYPTLVAGHEAVWHLRLDLYKLLKLERDPNYRDVLNSITGVRLSAQLTDARGQHAAADAHFVAHYSARDQHLRISTSTTDARAPSRALKHVPNIVRPTTTLGQNMGNSITGVRLSAQLADARGQHAAADAHFVAHYSARDQHLRISTSTTDARVGEYIIFHVQSNFYMETFNYVVMSKGIILTTAQEIMQDGVRTFAVTVSAEMAPVATVVAWSADRRRHVIADSLTFPVNGISRNNFTVYVNNRKHRTGERVEVAVYGEPGAYVGLSAIDDAFFTMQAGNELTYAKVISKMAHFDEATNGTFAYTWRSHFGDADELVYFPASTFGVDANRTFEYAGLVVFSDVAVPRRPSACNATAGFLECLEGGCFHQSSRCDGKVDCSDRTDESNCQHDDWFELSHFRQFRFNRVQRQYDNVWLWRDINIGPHGRTVLTVDVPQVPAHWTISAFSMSPTLGLGMLHTPIRYSGVLPFFIKVEGPDECRQGEQLGLRVVVFNYQPQAIEAVVVLAASSDYKFVHVEENGIVRSYNPRTSFGEHQFFVWIAAGDAATVHVPVVATRLGRVHVRLHASTLMGQHHYTKTINVLADGLPQHRHQSILLDLSNRAYVFQYMHVNVTETPVIPYEVDRYYVFGSNRARVSIVGDVVGPLFPTMPVNASSLLQLPMDSAEQNMFSFAANMYLTLYMRLINQRNRTLEHDAFYHMNILYQRQLSFMKPDGSFSLFRSDWNQSASSVWLTSFCAKIFQDASFNEWENFIYIDPNVISLAVDWVLQHQLPHGAFYEVTWLPSRNDNSTLHVPAAEPVAAQLLADPNNPAVLVNNTVISQRNITLTAQVVITLETVKNLKDIGIREGLSARVVQAQQRAISYLEKQLRLLDEFGEPYALALVAHALTFSKAPSSEHAYRLLKRRQRAEGGLVYWGREPVPPPPYKMENQKPFLLPRLPYKYDSNNIAATAYALLACMDHQDNNEAIVMWLNAQRLHDGGWASTQDTYIALRALIEYTNRKRLRDVSALALTIDAVALNGSSRVLHIDNNNLAVMQSVDIPEAWGTVKVTARGAGYAILQMSVQYNVDVARFQTDPPVRAFHLAHQPLRYYGRNQSHIEMQSCASWSLLSESPRSGLAVLDVGIPTGYMIQQQRLDAYVLSRRVRTLQRAKYTPSKLTFYFHYLDHEPTCVNYTIERWYPVANMSRYLPVRVYDYYAPERYNESIFDALPTYLLNICEVCGSSQCPYCAIYNAAARASSAVLLASVAVVACLVTRALAAP
ncbi:CD109 antigen [Ostrinia nubilalis]|uniref:CD109 antigen n=1 Tax=Ostrinia nubilalis TaxID=29057 RepID=UPI0030825441